MKLRHRFLLSAAALAGIMLLIIGAARSAQTLREPARQPPRIESLSPHSVRAGSPDFTLTVSGLYFAQDSVVRWNGGSRPTVVVDGTFAQAKIRADDVASPGFAAVTVLTPSASGERPGVSAPEVFRITPAGAF
jgi:hypothetical protein